MGYYAGLEEQTQIDGDAEDGACKVLFQSEENVMEEMT